MMSIELKTIFFQKRIKIQNLICSHLPSNDFLTKIRISCFERWKRLRCSIVDFAISVSTSENKNNWTKAEAPNKSTNSFLLFVIVH
jgi:hypothetical protein